MPHKTALLAKKVYTCNMGECFYKPPIMVDYRIKTPVVNLFVFWVTAKETPSTRAHILYITAKKLTHQNR